MTLLMPRGCAFTFALLPAFMTCAVVAEPAPNEAETVALWLFDEQIGIYPSSVLGDAALLPGKEGHCPLDKSFRTGAAGAFWLPPITWFADAEEPRVSRTCRSPVAVAQSALSSVLGAQKMTTTPSA